MTDYTTTRPQQRTGLQKARDIALTVMAVLVSIVCLLLLYVGVAAGSALSDVSNRLSESTPTPAFTFDTPAVPDPVRTNADGVECIGEEAIPGC
ncbi:hypothetical protein Q0Z83_060330 [Actinoplanes sichuanensis]|uniref:Uncharacterized protein n=1 Tax=Actinoplanes sichuanensis TaxID=512349 RepID=A0ABW4A6N7_9ACTN|nr:hypothetical protein [Actinoplanes sichuanensis]BEL07842.1 hypothetical protein Q0Z83_060330 [Actinoplanes sichuanensis]